MNKKTTTTVPTFSLLLLMLVILIIAAGIGCAPLDGTATNFKKQAELNLELGKKVQTLEAKVAVMEFQNANQANTVLVELRDLLDKKYPKLNPEEIKARATRELEIKSQ